MEIERERLENFKLFKSVTLDDVPPYCVPAGANGVGKSTLFDVFGFLTDCLKDNVRPALAKRGSFKEVVSRGTTASETILHASRDGAGSRPFADHIRLEKDTCACTRPRPRA